MTIAEQIAIDQRAALEAVRKVAESLPGYQVNSVIESGIMNRRGDLVLATPKPPLTPVLALVGADAVAKYRLIPSLTPEQIERFWSKVDVVPGCCWDWQGSCNATGYGKVGLNGQTFLAHRVARQMLVGDMSPELDGDHMCRRPSCCNPDHLLPAPHRSNVLRGYGPLAHNKRKTHCRHGHPFTPENTRIFQTRFGEARRCAMCAERATAEREERRRLALIERGPIPRKKQTHCKRGHPLTGDNLLSTRSGHRCKTCARQLARERYHRNKARKQEAA